MKLYAERLQQPLQLIHPWLYLRDTQRDFPRLGDKPSVQTGAANAIRVDEHENEGGEGLAELRQAAIHSKWQLQQTLVLLIGVGLAVGVRASRPNPWNGAAMVLAVHNSQRAIATAIAVWSPSEKNP